VVRKLKKGQSNPTCWRHASEAGHFTHSGWYRFCQHQIPTGLHLDLPGKHRTINGVRVCQNLSAQVNPSVATRSSPEFKCWTVGEKRWKVYETVQRAQHERVGILSWL